MNNLRDLDLNLLVILDVLLAERHVSRTAARLEMSQPAVSHALKRLRHLFADPLLVRAGSQLRPTPFALEIGENLHEALAAIRKTMRRDDKFVPSTVRRTFKLAMSDYGAFIFLPGILSHLRRFAPNTDLIVVTGTREEQIERLISGELDLAIGVFPAVPPTVRTSRLFAEQFACLLDRHNRFCKGPFTLESYLNSPHLLVSVRGDPVGEVEATLADLGVRRRIAAIAPHFLVAPLAVVGTDLVLTLARRALTALTPRRQLAVREPPFPIPSLNIVQIWHARTDEDGGNIWLRDVVGQQV